MPVHADHTVATATLQWPELHTDSWATAVVPRLPAPRAEQARTLTAFQRPRGLACPAARLRALLA